MVQKRQCAHILTATNTILLFRIQVVLLMQLVEQNSYFFHISNGKSDS